LKEGFPSFVIVNRVLKESVKKLDEDRGRIIADYQKQLEDEWIKQLRSKYSIIVNQEVLSRLK
jgi:peptidyl-prolyl cis-trans isomerase SurA